MNIDMARGDQFPISFKIKNRTTGEYITEVDKILITFRKEPKEGSPILFQRTTSEVEFDSETNKVRFYILRDDTKDLDYGTYGFDIEITIGDLIKTKIGRITITDKYSPTEV